MASNVLLRLLPTKNICGFVARKSLVCSQTSKYSSFLRSVSSILSLNDNSVGPFQRHITEASRLFSNTQTVQKAKDEVSVTFIDRDGDKTTVTARVGDSLLDVAKDNGVDLEGACEGTLACSTCHLIFDPEQFNTIPLEPPSEEELDMLDLAYGLTDTSRLGCQIIVTKELDGLVVTVPFSTADARFA